MRKAIPTEKESAAVPVGSWEKYQYTMSVPAKNTAQPMNRPPSTLTRYLPGAGVWSCDRVPRRSLAVAVRRGRRRDRLPDSQRGPALLYVRRVHARTRRPGTEPRHPLQIV